MAGTSWVTLDEVERALATDEALLTFQIGLWTDYTGDFQGGSWLLASTRAGTRAYRLPGREQLEPVMAFVGALFARRDGSEGAVVAGLYAQLMAAALGDLPDGVRRLVIVPDGPLHDLPFGALRSAPAAEPLIARYEITLVPSASLWQRWRNAASGPVPGGALALADPDAPGAARALITGMAPGRASGELGRLPGARREARAVMHEARGPSRLLAGAQASESALRRLDLRAFGVIHFAAHAVVDQEEPERTSVVLAPGGGEQDGLLQAREIAELDLAGRLIVLSACRGASGPRVGGEGALSLARAFFQAGATSVIASLWPLRDDETSWLMERFYGHLGTGMTAAAALRAAQHDAQRAHLPGAAWSGLVLFGEGSVRPFQGPRRARLTLPIALSAAALLGIGALVWWRRRALTA